MFSQCSICLCENRKLRAIVDTDDEKVSWQQKLKSFIPEELPETFKVCKLCCEEVDRTVSFQKQCLEAIKRFNMEMFCCVQCNKTFKQKSALSRHIIHFHRKMRLKTINHNTDLSFTSLDTHNDHSENELDSIAESKLKIPTHFTCNICLSILKSKYCLKRHVNNVHAKLKRFSCNQCNQKFVNNVYLKAHLKYHSKERPYVCTKCGKRFYSMSDLNHHEKIHANIRAYRCDICSKSFNTASDRTKHQICVHSDPATWRFSCTVCGRKFPISCNRDAHERTHIATRSHCCHLCGRSFTTTYTLRRHIKAHSEEKSFKCAVRDCNAEYKNPRSLAIHNLKKHKNGEDKTFCANAKKKITYNCQICSKLFASKIKLDKHMCSHTGERPFQCDLCAKSFIDKSYVKQHMKIVHDVT